MSLGYEYLILSDEGKRMDSDSSLLNSYIELKYRPEHHFVLATDRDEDTVKLKTAEDFLLFAKNNLDEWEVKQFENYLIARENATPTETNLKDHINPTHYKGVAAGKEYIELMQDLLKGYEGVEAHLLGQIYKYSMRLGKKDSKEQDSNKISWYAQCLNHYYRTGEVKTGWK